MVRTDMSTEDPEACRVWKVEMLMDEFADPNDVTPVAAYLASAASSFMTGQSIVIDGGYLVR